MTFLQARTTYERKDTCTMNPTSMIGDHARIVTIIKRPIAGLLVWVQDEHGNIYKVAPSRLTEAEAQQ